MTIAGRLALRLHPVIGDRLTLWLYAAVVCVEAAYYERQFRRTKFGQRPERGA